MLDRRFIIENTELVRANTKNRNMEVDFDKFLDLDRLLRSLKVKVEEINRLANEQSTTLKSQKRKPSEDEIILGRQFKERRAGLEVELRNTEADLLELQQSIPNLTDSRAPIGESDQDNLFLEHGSTPKPTFDFEIRDHVELGKIHNLFDFESASKVTGQGFYYLKGDAVRLDLAIQLYAISILEHHGFEVIATPDIARLDLIAGTGYNPRGTETQIYSIENSNLGLIATSEITIAGMYADMIVDERDLPIKLAGLSHCFRTEAGSGGRATRGLYRVHQFSKVEMFAFTRPEESAAMHLKMLEIEKEIFDGLGIHYRVVENATGDLGASAYRKFDMEAWMPGRGEYGEITSASNCTDYQARRLKIRLRSVSTGKSLGFLHTLNGTATATGRAMVAILETYQDMDGSIRIPEPLQAIVGKTRIER